MMKYTEKQEEKIFIIDDTITSAGSRPETGKWKILIIDDDVEIHKITRLVLSGFTFNEKSLEFFSAYSEKEARLLIDQNPDAALIFLDVVMEQDDSGLRLIEYIRNIKINPFVRIVLRTGQPGQAPEEKVIHDYDINDYKEKTELTARKLYTTTISALRAYLDLKRIDDNRKGLERIVKSSENILNYKSVTEFISNALIQLIPILGPNKASPGEFSCFALSLEDSGSNIIAATGRYTGFIGLAAGAALGENITAELSGTRKNIFHDDHIILYIESKYGAAKLIYIEGKYELDVFDRELVEAYVTNLAIVCDNIYLTIENEETQREIIFGLGELSEARSEETGRHVKRVAEYCRLLANLYGLDEEMRDDIYIASTMHDVGKLVIPDMIINKPGRLTPEEFEIIRQHTTIGHEMLKISNRPVMKLASIIASQHHEKFDGTGYPYGLKGENIHIAGRIAALADVFDALGSKRVYKTGWSMEDSLELLKAEKGKHFDPDLIDVLMDNLDKFIDISIKFSD